MLPNTSRPKLLKQTSPALINPFQGRGDTSSVTNFLINFNIGINPWSHMIWRIFLSFDNAMGNNVQAFWSSAVHSVSYITCFANNISREKLLILFGWVTISKETPDRVQLIGALAQETFPPKWKFHSTITSSKEMTHFSLVSIDCCLPDKIFLTKTFCVNFQGNPKIYFGNLINIKTLWSKITGNFIFTRKTYWSKRSFFKTNLSLKSCLLRVLLNWHQQ